MIDEHYLTTKQEQGQRKRSDLEEALGDRFWPLLDDPDVREVNIRPNGAVWYQRVGRDGGKFQAEWVVDHEESENIAHAILQCLDGKYVLNEEQHYVNCKLQLSSPDEFARVHLVGEWATADGGYGILLRKHHGIAPTVEEWVKKGQMTPEQLVALRWTVTHRRNTLICGPMFAGKSTLINSRYELIHRLDPTRAVGYIQDVPETVCPLSDRMALMVNKYTSYRKHCEEGFRQSVEEVTINELRGAEAYNLIHNLWLSGHNGGATTLHAVDERQAMWRLGTLIREGLPQNAVLQPEVIAAAVHVIVILRFSHRIGRRIVKVLRVKGARADGSYEFEPLAPSVPWPESDFPAAGPLPAAG
ncbi:hypothetical protein EPN44_14400 [bacterium]|nr:MAG: hypothetical protein EPN44_14400 [bacterium]